MKTIRLFQASTFLTLTLIAAGCANDETMKTEQQGSTPAGTTVFSGETYLGTKTRTMIVDHTKGAGAKVIWAATDKIWVKDNTNTWHESDAASFHELPNKAKAMFTLNGTYTGATHDVIYTNLPITGTPQVEIKAQQTQPTPNNFDHASESGDFGIATAHGGNGSYSFLLNHKASYLCFLPRCMNVDLGKNIYLTKVTITANKPIAGTFNIVGGSIAGNAPTANSSNTITLATTNFPLNTTVANVATNAAYMVIAPGTYNFTIGYTIKDPTTNVEGTITKTLTAFTCSEGNIHDITAWIDKDITLYQNQMYMWDARTDQPYWNGVANYPVVNDATNNAYPHNSADPRWCNEGPTIGVGAPFRSAASMPSANEYMWYAQRGNPHWDGDKLWAMDKHLYKGGMWIKKKSYISGFTSTQTPTGANLNTTPQDYSSLSNIGATPIQGRPAQTVINQYFFLPANGYYDNEKLKERNSTGYYTTKTATASLYTAIFWFYSSYIGVGVNLKTLGTSCMPMQ